MSTIPGIISKNIHIYAAVVVLVLLRSSIIMQSVNGKLLIICRYPGNGISYHICHRTSWAQAFLSVGKRKRKNNWGQKYFSCGADMMTINVANVAIVQQKAEPAVMVSMQIA